MRKNKYFLTALFSPAPVGRLLLNHRTAALCFFLAFSCFFGVGAYAQNMTKQQFQQMYINYLKAEGFSPNVDSDGDVAFKYEGRTYYIIVYEDDPQFFSIIYPNFWKIESDDEQIQAVFSATEVTRRKKVVKVYLTTNDNVSISADILLKNPADFSAVFYRLMGQIVEARQDFIDEMRSWGE